MKTRKIQSFLFDCDMLSNEKKVVPVVAKHGTEAERVLVHLLSIIYGSDQGYYVELNDRTISKIVARCGANAVSPDFVEAVVNSFVDSGFFDSDLYYKHSVLTSEEIQRRWDMAVKRRNIRKEGLEYFILSDKKELKHKKAIELLQARFRKDFGVSIGSDILNAIDRKLSSLLPGLQEYGSAEVLLLVAIRRMMDYTFKNPARYFYKGLFGDDAYLLRPTPSEESTGSYIKLVKSRLSSNQPKAQAIIPPKLKKVGAAK